jgi:glycosyltransferase involved in cell wall biosynthesis
MTRRRALVVVTLLPRRGETGVQTHFNALLARADERGCPNGFVSPWERPQIFRRAVSVSARAIDRLLGHEYGTTFLRRGFMLLLLLRAAWLTRRWRSHRIVLYAQDPSSARAVLALKRVRPQLRVVLFVHFNVSEVDELIERRRATPAGPVAGMFRRDEEVAFDRVDLAMFPSAFSRRAVRDRLGAGLRAPSTVVPHFVEPPVRSPDVREDVEHPIDGDLITVGTLEPRKNHAYLLRVLSRLHDAGLRVSLTIVGDGPLRGPLQDLAEELGVAANVRFLGRVVPAADLIGRHRVYVHAARVESFGIVLVEALARGRPVCAPPVGAVPEIIRHGEEGLLWSLDDDQGGAEALTSILTDERYYRTLARNARTRYESAFSPRALERRWLAALCGE